MAPVLALAPLYGKQGSRKGPQFRLGHISIRPIEAPQRPGSAPTHQAHTQETAPNMTN